MGSLILVWTGRLQGFEQEENDEQAQAEPADESCSCWEVSDDRFDGVLIHGVVGEC